jgi:GNAT superfamily N-acetyltransferase
MIHSSEKIRLLTTNDIPLIERLLRTSEYIYQRFTLEELPLLLKRYPSVGLFNGNSLSGFLLSQSINAPSAWIGGFGVSWTESDAYLRILFALLEQLTTHLITRKVQYLHYSGNDIERDWLRSILLTRDFVPNRLLYAYDKYDYDIPTSGNTRVMIRPVNLASDKQAIPTDMVALLDIEKACFESLWRYDATAFEDIATTHPYFVVAELNGKVVGYQFNALDNEFGYLVRIAVHPSVSGQAIGARLMAEAIRFFQQERVLRIMLNTQDNNTHAHRLYEWFGFERIDQLGFVLRKTL